jgi:V8-like Glu-specific endopeptidase
MNFFYIIISIAIISNSTNATHDVMKLVEKQTPRLIRSIVPNFVFTKDDLKVDERQKLLLKNATPLNSEKSLYELKENARKEVFFKPELSLVTKKKPSFIDKIPYLNFLNFLFDNRVIVNNPIVYPYTSIAFLEAMSSRNNGMLYWRGSGFLIGPRVLLTAKHCIDPGLKNNSNITFNALFGKTGISELFDSKAIKTHVHPTRDIAVILLDQEVGLKLGALNLSKKFSEKQKVSVFGYPGVKTFSSYFRNSGETEMYGMVGPIIKISSGKIMYSLDTSGGQSGGPISNIQTEESIEELTEHTAYGVHTNGGLSYNIGEAYDDNFEEFILSSESLFLDFLEQNT